MSELRESIKKAHLHLEGVDMYDEEVDAILTAVIASIPEDLEDSEYSAGYEGGYNWALGQVRSILQSAKSISKESE